MIGDGKVYLVSPVGGGQVLKLARRKGSAYFAEAEMPADLCAFLTMADGRFSLYIEDENGASAKKESVRQYEEMIANENL